MTPNDVMPVVRVGRSGAAGLLLLLCAGGCGYTGYRLTTPAPDASRVKRITPGKTTFSDILDWFGPPHAIIDGTRQIPEFRGPIFVPTPARPATRTFTSPQGQVILVYEGFEYAEHSSGTTHSRTSEWTTTRKSVTKDLLVYVSKDRRIVTAFAYSGEPTGFTRDRNGEK
jgi:hypothetical protein